MLQIGLVVVITGGAHIAVILVRRLGQSISSGSIESALKQEIVQALKRIDPDYSDWMITVNLEVEQKAASVSTGRHHPR